MSGQKIIPPVVINRHRSLAGYCNIHRLITLHTKACLRVKLHYADVSEICSISEPEPSVRSHHQTGINGIAILMSVGFGHHHRFCKFKIRGCRVKRLVPHGKDSTYMTVGGAATGRTVCDKIPVTNLHGIRSRTASGSHGSSIPYPSVFRDESSTSGSEGIVLAVTLHNSGRVMDKRTSRLGGQSYSTERSKDKTCQYPFIHAISSI